MDLLVLAGRTIFQKNNRKIMTQSIHGCHQHTDFNRDARDNNRIDTKHPKGLIEIGLEEGAEPPLG